MKTVMKALTLACMMAVSAAAEAGLWEGVKDENHVCGPKITERDLLGKAVLLYYISDSDAGIRSAKRIEELWKNHDRKRFYVIASWVGDTAKAEGTVSANKLSFPVYKEVKLASDASKRIAGAVVIVNQYGKVLASTGMHDSFKPDHERMLVEAITAVGMPPEVAPGVMLDKYKSLKTKLKLGNNLKGVVSALEKDVKAGEKKSATAQVKAKADEASSILSAISTGKSDIKANIDLLTTTNPEEAYRLLSLYVKSFPEEAADNKERLAELKTKAAEAKKQAK